MRPIRIITNFERFPDTWSISTGEHGVGRMARDFAGFRDGAENSDLLLINGDVGLVYKLCLFFLLIPWKRRPIVAVDLVLQKPSGVASRAASVFKKALFSRVDHFVNYFRESEGYSKYFGITPERSSFVHFKPNLRYRYEPQSSPEGEYVLCFGRSQRDYDTFFRSMATLPFPGAIPRPDFAVQRQHNSRFTYRIEELPPEVRLLDDDGSQEGMIQAIEGARLVVLPILASSIAASGISVYLNAMLLHKCVIISAGPGVTDVLRNGEALLVPPENPDALSAMIRRAWEDDELRLRTADTGYRHALNLGGEPELYQRVLEKAINYMRGARERKE